MSNLPSEGLFSRTHPAFCSGIMPRDVFAICYFGYFFYWLRPTPMNTLIRPFVLTAVALLPALPLQAESINQSLPERVEQALKANKLPLNAVSLVMLPLTSNETPTVFNADVSVNPASTMKLVTTYAALELLGPTHQWKTDFYTDGTLKNGVLQGNLYLKGGGDPKLNLEKLWLLMRDLRANGVRQVAGDLVLDRSYFIPPENLSFDDDGGNPNKPFLVAPDALLINLKAMRAVVRNEAGAISVVLEPPMANLTVDNRIKSQRGVKCADWPDIRYNLTQDQGQLSLVVSGTLPEGCSGQTYLSPLDHAQYAAGAVRAIWQELGGSIQGGDRLGPVPTKARLLARALSPDLVEIIRDINKYSNNTMARQLFLSIGSRFRTPADANDAQAASRAVHDWFTKKGIDSSHLVMENGSGLSRDERVSVREMAYMLQAAWHSPFAAEFIASMPLVAMDGTMRKRLRNTGVAGNAHIKTGTLNNVRAIAGFCRDGRGNTWVVVAILNHSQPWGASAILDQVLVSLQAHK